MKRKKKQAEKRVRSARKTPVKPAAQPAATLVVTTNEKPVAKPRARRKRLSIGEALRKRGLDEYSFAERFEKAGAGEGGVKKADFDYLKEWSRYLEPALPGESEDNEGPVPVILMHNIDRPVRERKVEDQKVEIQAEEAP